MQKKTPKDVTEFEREQLSFFLSQGNVATTLAELNPSLAWLPVLEKLELIKREQEVVPWIDRNFGDADAVREVVANLSLGFFNEESARYIEIALSHTRGLSALLTKCWFLIIRHMRTFKRSALRNGWDQIALRIERGDRSQELLEQIAQGLRPAPRLGKRITRRVEESGGKPERPSDLMSIDYVTDEVVSAEGFLAVWPDGTSAETDRKLLGLLTDMLISALEDAIEAEVEGKRGFGTSDVDVPSVAGHKQNAYHSGFLPIVRVAAELWTRLIQKQPTLALEVLGLWRASNLRLIKRLALFAVADARVPAGMAADTLLSLTQDEVFRTGASVEVYRLLQQRWAAFPAEKREQIENRAVKGPPTDAFIEGADKNRIIDGCRFELLGNLERLGTRLGPDAAAALADIRARWPQWIMRPAEQAGFHVWLEGGTAIAGNASRLQGIPDEQLVAAAREAQEKAGFRGGDIWDALIQNEPARALRALEARAQADEWPVSEWQRFLWASQRVQDADAPERVARLLLRWPKKRFTEIVDAASWWLNETARLIGDDLLWPLWDLIGTAAPRDADKALSGDALTDALGVPAGRLAEVLIKRLPTGDNQTIFRQDLRTRLDRLVTVHGMFGKLARVRLAAEVSFLFERIPEWTREKIIPLFDWSSLDAAAAWTARSHARYIGSPALFDLTKVSFLELFDRRDLADETIRTFAEWLAAIMVGNRQNAGYDITGPEARQALRRAGVNGLTSVGHRLAIEMEGFKAEEKIAAWRDVIGPAFKAIWPLDVDLQSAETTFKLVQIIRAAGGAFPEAVDMIVPFIRPEDPHKQPTVFSISKADEVLYTSSPEKMLNLLVAVVDDKAAVGAFGLRKALDRLRNCAPSLVATPKFQRLLNLAGQA